MANPALFQDVAHADRGEPLGHGPPDAAGRTVVCPAMPASASVSAKHGVVGLVKALALEGAADGIRAVAICPGYVRTPLVVEQMAAQADAHGMPKERVLKDVILDPHVIKELIEPAEVAELAAFLAGPSGRAFTGVPIAIDQGWTAR
jgi:3-hydroxybutyrate dehydrogenase